MRATDVAAAYLRNTSGVPEGFGPAKSVPLTTGTDNAVSPASTFSTLIKDGIDTAVKAQENAEKISAEAVLGQANVTEVVTAIANAEATLRTVVAVRDRMISAYQEIMRMPI